MNANTGETIYEQVLSFDVDNNPVVPTTFDYTLYYNNIVFSGGNVQYSLTDISRGMFTFSWSAETYGNYQLYVKNNSTNVIFISDTVNIIPVVDTNIYIGI